MPGAGAALFRPPSARVDPGALHGHDAHGAYATATRSVDRALAWPRVEAWLSDVVDRCGANLLRLKAVLAIEGEEGPVALHTVQHVIHRPERLPAWPDGMGQGRIVVIGQGLDPARLDRILGDLLD